MHSTMDQLGRLREGRFAFWLYKAMDTAKAVAMSIMAAAIGLLVWLALTMLPTLD